MWSGLQVLRLSVLGVGHACIMPLCREAERPSHQQPGLAVQGGGGGRGGLAGRQRSKWNVTREVPQAITRAQVA